MRVLQIISGFAIEGPLGGIERFVVDLVRELPASIESTVCGMWDYRTAADRYWLEQLQGAGIEAFTAAPWVDASPYQSIRASLAGTRRALSGQRVDIIHSHCQFGDPLALLLQRELGAHTLIRTLHNEREWPRRPLRRWLFSGGVALFGFDHEIGVSRAVVEVLNRRPLARLLRRRALLSYNSLALERFREHTDAGDPEPFHSIPELPSGARVIGSVGRLEPQKGYAVLLEAMPAIVAAHPEVHLVIAGDGSEMGALRAHAAASPAARHIHLAGPVRPIEPFYRALEVFVSSSLWEGLPTVILESIAAGVPVVATDVSGSRELIEDGRQGWLVPPNNAKALADAVIHALRERGERQRRADAAKAVLERFDMRQAAAFHHRLYTAGVE